MVKRIATIAVLIGLVVCVLLFQLLSPPAEWRGIRVGMSRAEVHQIIPEFDTPWGDIKADFHHKDCGFAYWRIAVIWEGDHVESVERELWTNWPEKCRLRTIVQQRHPTS